MSIDHGFVHLPAPEHFSVLHLLIVLIFLLHLPYISKKIRAVPAGRRELFLCLF